MDKTDFGQVLCKAIALALLASLFLLVFAILTEQRQPAVGDVRGFSDTEIVAHPDVPLDPTKNIIWCGTMGLAWNQLVAMSGGPVACNPPLKMVDALNRGEFTANDLDSDSYVVMAGKKLDNIEGKFREELHRKFGNAANPPKLDGADPAATPQDIVVYAYLLKNSKFSEPFNSNIPLSFGGNKVASFGFGHERFTSVYAPQNLTTEVKLLDYTSTDNFVIQLKTKSDEDQLVLAKVPPGKSLQETIETVVPKINPKVLWGLDEKDKLTIPKIDYDLTTHFQELEGRTTSAGRLKTVAENIVFRLNENGVQLKAFSTISATLAMSVPPPEPIDLVFDKPFLVLMKRASSPRPYFAMWVGNPTLLVSP